MYFRILEDRLVEVAYVHAQNMYYFKIVQSFTHDILSFSLLWCAYVQQQRPGDTMGDYLLINIRM